MWLVCAWVLLHLQDTGLPLPPDVDRSVPLEVVEVAAPVETAKPLQERTSTRPRKLVDRSNDRLHVGSFVLWSSVVVVLLVAFFLVFRRFTKNSRLFGTNQSIDVIGKRGLGPKQAIFLVEVGGKVLVVGSTRENLSTLGQIENQEEIDSLRQMSQGSPNRDGFRKSLSEGLREYENEPAAKKPSRYTGLVEELSELKKTVGAWRA